MGSTSKPSYIGKTVTAQDELRHQVYGILAQITPTAIASLTSWDFIITALSGYSSAIDNR
jgi:hypothetical protein